jgi:hypothetical protein
MKRDNPAKHFILAFLIALMVYIFFYHWIEHRRTWKGPWQVAFTRSESGDPAIVIQQPALAISNIQIRFTGEALPETNVPVSLTFSQPREVPYGVPFGKCIFMDATFLPGTLTFQLFGHEIELLPRVMIIDHDEHAWKSGEVITLSRAQTTTGSANGQR